MIDVKNKKVEEVIQGMHEAMLKMVKRGRRMKEDIVLENRIFSALCHNFDMEPMKCAVLMNEKYSYDLTGDEVIQIFRNRKISNPIERKKLLQWAEETALLFSEAVTGNIDRFKEFEKRRREPQHKNGKRHDSQDRMAIIMIYEKYPEIDQFDDIKSLHLLGNTLAKYYFYDVVDSMCDVYGYPQHQEAKKTGKYNSSNKKMTYEQALRRINQLENKLERTNVMLQDLQDEFEEQLENSKVKELADFFARLNSEKYGCILDELLVIRKGVDELRRSDYELPIEINGLLIMIKKLIQFVRDSHIEPVMKIASIREVAASEVEFCIYEGTPFTSPEEKKKIKVISPGWIYKDKELQISRPKVREEE